ncbi:MAG: thioredoxin-dependent thiol peroxidase [Cyanobacteria bacterium RI_101]|nr:thioredoxin-dependent thiol peroxidase [Cyanobacteria bacterium RI_101]
MANALSPGLAAPPFTAPAADGQTYSLTDFAGSWLVLYFYPKDNTPGCATEAQEFSQRREAFAQLGAQVAGVSPDSLDSHGKFIQKKELTILLLSDPDHVIAEAYGAWGLKKFMGKEYLGILRSTFLINPQGEIAHIWPKVKVKDHAETVLRTLTALTGDCF